MTQISVAGEIVTHRGAENDSGNGQFTPLLTLCDWLLRMFAGLPIHCIDTLAIPEVLIGGVNFRLTT